MVGSEARGQEGKSGNVPWPTNDSHPGRNVAYLPGFPAILQPRLMTALKLTGKRKGWNDAWRA